MITPRHINQALAAIRNQGLIEQDFELTSNKDELVIKYKKADFYFRFAPRAALPTTPLITAGAVAQAVTFALRPYSIEYKPSILSPPTDVGPIKNAAKDFDYALNTINRWLTWIKKQYGPFETPTLLAEKEASRELLPALAKLHPTIQQAANSLFATDHYREAILNAYIAIDNAVKEKAQLHGEYGTRLMERAFSINNPILKIGSSQDEQQGFLSLFRGAMLAIRNPKTHSLSGTDDEQRALEWLSFASVLMRNLDEAVLAQPTATPPTP